MAEVPASKLVEAHGTFSTASCIRCHKSYDGEQIKVSLPERHGRRSDLMVSALSLDGVVRFDPWPGSCRGGEGVVLTEYMTGVRQGFTQ